MHSFIARTIPFKSATTRFVCKTCRIRLAHSSVATATIPDEHLGQSSQTEVDTDNTLDRLRVAVLLSRAPQITRNLTSFEEAFYFYQQRLNERLAIPFTRYFYVKKDTPADIERKGRARASKERGDYDPYGLQRDQDELQLDSNHSAKEFQTKRLLADAEFTTTGTSPGDEGDSKKELLERPHNRRTKADEDMDYRSLNRKLDQSLYLVVKANDEWYRLPSGCLKDREHLITGAERVLADSAGINMNTWFIGHAPVGHAELRVGNGPRQGEKSGERTSSTVEKIFFMKGRIMAGQADSTNNHFGITDWRWLCKEELGRFCRPDYFAGIKNLLVDR